MQLRPMRRRPDGTYEPVDLDTAITKIAAGFKRIRDALGGASIFYYGGGDRATISTVATVPPIRQHSVSSTARTRSLK